jgi:hypothetical protein
MNPFTSLPIFGDQFHEPFWDQEFCGRLDRAQKLYVEYVIADGHGPFFLSTAFLDKLGYEPKANAAPKAVLRDGDQWHPIYAVGDIVKKPRRKPSYAAQRARFDPRWQGTWAIPADLQDGRFINKTGLGTYYGLSPSWIKRLEAWLRSKSKTVFLKPNRYSAKAPPVRLYDRDLVETFIKTHAAEMRRWQRRYQRKA